MGRMHLSLRKRLWVPCSIAGTMLSPENVERSTVPQTSPQPPQSQPEWAPCIHTSSSQGALGAVTKVISENPKSYSVTCPVALGLEKRPQASLESILHMARAEEHCPV